jgi:hypothetical protein
MLTVKLHELDRLALLVAMHVTVVTPRANVTGFSVEAEGVQLTLVMPLPEVAVTVGV